MGSSIGRNSFVPDPFVAQALAAVQALEFAVTMGDSLTVIKKIGTKQGDKSNIRAIIAYRKSRASYQFKFIPRKANQAAHLMAKEGAIFNIDRFWVEEVPASVRQQIIADR
ncbi:hypothetical protein CXB51_006033 [Gossypium anomalum]|uniref:RNase H type-1 domain-containing protein n=1 Tax=Gossypium anomalum TaxID=47600 RepID=A0A8J6DCG8_9ROSI|nr:hypothetical protein CXB51_006033 [Gossypium anomalum]